MNHLQRLRTFGTPPTGYTFQVQLAKITGSETVSSSEQYHQVVERSGFPEQTVNLSVRSYTDGTIVNYRILHNELFNEHNGIVCNKALYYESCWELGYGCLENIIAYSQPQFIHFDKLHHHTSM